MTVDPDAFRALVEHLIPMNRHLGLKLERFDLEGSRVVTRLEMRPEFIGNPVRRIPHGGLISLLIDATAGAAALSLDDMTLMDKVATIDCGRTI
jgi:acyl-coenzyme A thioesterase PaaI-like protein